MENEFLKLQQKVHSVIEKYHAVRKELNINSPGHSRTIKDLARPFLNGHFTLAIIGKMSSGKSTFINALLEKKDLLATGFGQTTCTLTEIIHSDEEHYEVVFADGKANKFSSIQDLQNHMAIPKEYSDLPIKQINDLIINGKNASQIWGYRQLLEDKTGAPISEEKLKKYCATHSKSNIPKKVVVYTQLPKGFHGWKLVDTPGIAAKGGVEDETYELLNSKDETGKNNTVDAFIFVNSAATQIEDSTFQSFVKETINSLTDIVKKRLFLVRTHGADRNYLRNKDQQNREAKKLFVEGLKIKEERIHVVDSLCHIFIKFIQENKLDLTSISSPTPEGWNDKLWEASHDIYRDAISSTEKKGIVKNSESITDEICSWGNFNNLITSLNSFVKEEKEQSFNKILNLIERDLEVECKKLKKNINTLHENKGNLTGLLEALEKEKANIEKVKKEMNTLLKSIQKKFNRESINKTFKPISDKVDTLSGNIPKMRDNMRKYLSEVDEQKQTLLDDLANHLGSLLKELLEDSNVIMSNIDFSAIVDQANAEATREKVMGYEKKTVKQSGVWGRLKRFFTFGNAGYEEVEDKNRPQIKKVTDQKEAEDYFRQQVQFEFSKSLRMFKNQLGRDIDIIGEFAQEELDDELQDSIQKAEELTRECQTEQKHQEELEKLQNQFDKISNVIKSIH